MFKITKVFAAGAMLLTVSLAGRAQQPSLQALLPGPARAPGPASVVGQPSPPAVQVDAPSVCTAEEGSASQPLQDAVTQQVANLPACQKDLAWLAWMGRAYNQLGRYPEAAEYLERALMLAPRQPPVQMQYALALAGSGDALSSIALLRDLLAEPTLPASLRVAVQQEIDRWTGNAAVAQWQHRVYLHTRAGYDSNLLGTPNLTSLTLTLPGQTLQLPLDPSYLRTPGAYSRVDAGWVAGKGPWQWAASLGGRHSTTAPTAGLQQAQASVEYATDGRYASATLGQLQSRIGTRYRTMGFMAGLQWDSASPGRWGSTAPQIATTHTTASPSSPGTSGSQAVAVAGAASPLRPVGPLNPTASPVSFYAAGPGAPGLSPLGFGANAYACQTRLGPELQNRYLDSNPVLSGRYVGVLLQRTCQLQGAGNPGQVLQAWQVSARWGVDAPRSAQYTSADTSSGLNDGSAGDAPSGATAPLLRAGGRQQQASLRVAVLGRGFAYRHQWLLDVEAFSQRDATGYSPLLEGGARRSLRRAAVRAEYSLPLPIAPQWQFATGAEWQNQSSNLVLFQQQSHGVYMALRRQW